MRHIFLTIKEILEQNRLIFGAGLLPFVLLSGLVLIGQWKMLHSIGGKMVFMPLAVGYIFFMLFLPIKPLWRILLGFIYIPVVGIGLGFWLYFFGCSVTQACL